jgi:predicted RND superfamily exporter protein
MPKTPKQNPPDIRSLQNKTMQERFKNAVSRQVSDDARIPQSPDNMSRRIIESLTTAAQITLPPVTKKTEQHEIWKDDNHLNYLIKERHKILQGSVEYKELTKRIKTQVNSLRNEKLKKEAEQINEHANRRRTEQLYRSMKSDNTSFRNINRGKQCDPCKMKEYFSKHFNQTNIKDTPIELTEAPVFLSSLQAIPENIMTTTPPDKYELLSTIKAMKSGKTANDVPSAYIKCATESAKFMDEMVNLYKTVWQTNTIPRNWGHSK